jgi:hypothetical protein
LDTSVGIADTVGSDDIIESVREALFQLNEIDIEALSEALKGKIPHIAALLQVCVDD